MSIKRVARYCSMCGTALEMRERTGATRPVCPSCDHTVYFDPKVAVAVFIRQHNRILLIKRGMNPLKGYWAMPAGFVDAGEDPVAAGRREVREETSLQVEITGLLDVFFTPDDGGLADIVIVYSASITGGHLQAADDAEEAAWFTKTDVPRLAFLPSQTIVARWQTGEIT